MEIYGSEFNEKVLENELPVIVDFYSSTCVPCMLLAPVIEELEDELDGEADVYEINATENQDIAQRYGIMSVPTILYIKDGKEINRSTGLVDKSEILEKIDL